VIRLLAVVLLGANLLLLGLLAGFFDAFWPRGREPQRVASQIAPDRLRVLPVSPVAPVAESAPAADAAGPSPSAVAPGAGQGAGAPAQAAGTGGPAPVAGAAAPAAALAGALGPGEPLCVEAGPLDEARVERLREWARGLREPLRAVIDRRPEAPSFMVYLPPAADPQRRLAQLRQLGVSDLYLIGEGPLRQAISLGIFRSQDGARARQGELAARGVQGTRIGPGPLRAERLVARLTRDPTAPEAAWREALVRLQAFAGAEPVACPTP
jgi:hypothetical protein